MYVPAYLHRSKLRRRKVQKAIGYIRVSTQGQADEGVSLTAQRAKIEAWCSPNDAELVAVFEHAGISVASMNGHEGLHAVLQRKPKKRSGTRTGDSSARARVGGVESLGP